jgi:PST family polysaccharide transporter
VNYFSRNTDNILIGKMMGNESLAYYSKGYTLMLYPVQNLTFVITPILHPILSDYQNDKQYIYNKYMQVTKLLSLLGVFVTGYCFFASREIVLLMFGNQWEKAVISFRILSISVWSQMMSSTAGAIFMSLDKTKVMFKSGVIQMIITVSMTIIGCIMGKIEYVALCVTVGLIFKFFIEFGYLIKKGFEYSYLSFLKKLLPDLMIFLFLITQSLIVNKLIHINSLLISAGFKLALNSIIYVLLLLLLNQTKFLTALLPRKLRKKVKK